MGTTNTPGTTSRPGTEETSFSRRGMMRTLIGTAGAVGGATGVLSLAACGAVGSSDGTPKTAASGKVLMWQEGTSELAKQTWTAMAASFKEANPKIDLTFDATPPGTGQTRDDKLFASLAAGTAWDVWQRDIPPSYQQDQVERLVSFSRSGG